MCAAQKVRGGVRPAAICPTMVAMQGTRRLTVMRHAKAGELPGGPDFERALKPRGRSDSTAAGEWLRDGGYRPDAVICSAARRTRQTWQYVSEVLGTTENFTAESQLYQADAEEVIEIIGATPAEVGTLLYIGHNPAAAGVVAILTGSEPHFPTAAIAVLSVRAGWDELAPGAGELLASWTPADG
jgi:phosphohistidine phosphatase